MISRFPHRIFSSFSNKQIFIRDIFKTKFNNLQINYKQKKRMPKNLHFIFAFFLAISFCSFCNAWERKMEPPKLFTSNESAFDCRQSGQECLHNGICSSNGKCKCSQLWFGPKCEYKFCKDRGNTCQNRGKCESISLDSETGQSHSFNPENLQSFRCHCKIGFGGKYCEIRLPTICNGLEQPCLHGICRLGQSVQEYKCDCFFGWKGKNCTEADQRSTAAKYYWLIIIITTSLATFWLIYLVFFLFGQQLRHWFRHSQSARTNYQKYHQSQTQLASASSSILGSLNLPQGSLETAEDLVDTNKVPLLHQLKFEEECNLINMEEI